MYNYVAVLPPRQEFKRAGYLKTEEVGCCYRCICDCAPSTAGVQAGRVSEDGGGRLLLQMYNYVAVLPPRQEFKRAGYLKTEEVGCCYRVYNYVTVLPPRQEFKRAGYLKTEEVGCCYRYIGM